MRSVILGAILYLNLILQTTIFSDIAIAGITPNVTVSLIISYAILRGDISGAIFGFFAGLLQDAYLGKSIGPYAILGLLTGFFCGKPFKDFYKENYLLPLFLIGFGVVVYELVFYVFFFLFQGKTDLIFYFVRIIFPEAIYTIVLAIPGYRIMYAVNKFITEREQFSRKFY